jgi:hypothetical protein
MSLTLTLLWRCGLALTLITVIVASACVPPPPRRVHGLDLSRLVLAALVLYATGALAALTHHDALAALVSGAGIAIAALAAWMSRGTEGEDPPPDDPSPSDEQPPPEPDGVPRVDWGAFERDFAEYARRPRTPAP